MYYSVIIPTLNSAEFLNETIATIRQARSSVEIIVVDGGSTDATAAIARSADVLFLSSAKGRGVQLQVGSQKASGDVLLFLHADTKLSMDAFEYLDNAFLDDQVCIGTFLLRFDVQHWLLSLYSFLAKIDSIWTTFGDQGIAVRRDFFDEIKGFPQWPLFEDVFFLQKARRKTKIHTFSSSVITSAEKFLQQGIIRQQIKNGWLLIQYLLGVSPFILYDKYYS